MMEMVAIGTSKFLPGFALAGVKTLLSSPESVYEDVTQQEGIVVVEETLLQSLPREEQREIRMSTAPVVVPLGEDQTSQMEEFRSMVRSTLGVDLFQ